MNKGIQTATTAAGGEFQKDSIENSPGGRSQNIFEINRPEHNSAYTACLEFTR